MQDLVEGLRELESDMGSFSSGDESSSCKREGDDGYLKARSREALRGLSSAERRRSDSERWPVVEGVGMHLHEQGKGMQSKEDLCGPGPFKDEGPFNPEHEPCNLIDGLYPNASTPPLEEARAASEELLEGDRYSCACNHGKV